MKSNCEWCVNPDADDAADPDKLCRAHLAEYEGLSVNELDRMVSEQTYDLM